MYNFSPRSQSRVSRHVHSRVLFASLKINRCTCVKYHCESILCVVYVNSIILCISLFRFLLCTRTSLRTKIIIGRQTTSLPLPSSTDPRTITTYYTTSSPPINPFPSASHTAPLPLPSLQPPSVRKLSTLK